MLAVKNNWTRILAVVYFILVAIGFYFLLSSRTGESITSPWQTIHPAYIYIFFAATLALGVLVVWGRQAGWLLAALIFHSLLLHSYLPLTHELVYGADQWRHMAVEKRLVEGKSLGKPVARGASAAAVEAGDFAYSGLWGVSALLAKALAGRMGFLVDYSLLVINKWLVPIIWSVAFPLLLFYLGRSLGWSKRAALFLVWLSALPFALQVMGSLTLPAGLGFLWWLAGLVILARRFSAPSRGQIYALFGIGAGLIFNHTLYLILFVLSWALAEVLRRLVTIPISPADNYVVSEVVADEFSKRAALRALRVSASAERPAKQFVVVALVIVIAMILPAAEWRGGYLQWGGGGAGISAGIKQVIGNFSAWYLASGPRPHDIATGNILFNQTPRLVFVPNLFTAWRWWLPVFALLFWLAVASGLIIAFRRRRPTLLFFGVLTVGLSLSYVITRYWLGGEQILNRRLDPALALLYLISAVLMFQTALQRYPSLRQRRAIFLGLIIFSSAMATSYSLGPDLSTVSRDEYRAMGYVWAGERNQPRHCVIADTLPLLALEAISGREIVGGGFPIDQYFAQPELARSREQLRQGWFERDSGTAYRPTGASQCWWVTTDEKLAAALSVAPGPKTNAKVFGKTVAVRYTQDNASFAPPGPQDFWLGIVPIEINGQ